MIIPSKQDRGLWVIALALAIITYSYANQSIQKSKIKLTDPSYKLLKLTAKTVPITVRFASTPPEGYKLLTGRVSTTPETVTLIGPEALLDETDRADTAIIDISQSTKKTIRVVPIETVAGLKIGGDPILIEVSIPIEKIEIPN